MGIFPRCLPPEWDSVQVSTTVLAHPTQSVAEEVVQQRSEDGLSPSRPFSPPSPLSTPLYRDVAQPSCAFLRAGWGGPGCARPLGVPPSFPQQPPPHPPLPCGEPPFTPFRPCGGSTESSSPPQTSGLSRYCRCAARQAHLLCGFFFFFFFFFGRCDPPMKLNLPLATRSPPGLGPSLPLCPRSFSFFGCPPFTFLFRTPPLFFYCVVRLLGPASMPEFPIGCAH